MDLHGLQVTGGALLFIAAFVYAIWLTEKNSDARARQIVEAIQLSARDAREDARATRRKMDEAIKSAEINLQEATLHNRTMAQQLIDEIQEGLERNRGVQRDKKKAAGQ